MSLNKRQTIENLKRLIDPPATPPEEREAARLALARVLMVKHEEQHIKRTVAQLFRSRMEMMR